MAYNSPLGTLYSHQEVCYFSIPIPSFHYSDETPVSSPVLDQDANPDPKHPLLARRETPPPLTTPLLTMDASRLLQLQTAAAYSASPCRPSAAHCDSGSSDSSASNGTSSPHSMGYVRCVRCQRSSSNASDPTKSGMISFGTNLYYCVRCAHIVGYVT